MGRFKQKKGFTIIEVALVLAIAGLIFLMVFIALPTLQRQARDTERREDIIALLSAIEKYQSNNRGVLPSDWTEAGDFWTGYLKSDFADPNGERYNISVVDCESSMGIGGECDQTDDIDSTTFPNDFTITVAKGASCDGSKAIEVTNPRKVAVLYRLEGSGVYCANT